MAAPASTDDTNASANAPPGGTEARNVGTGGYAHRKSAGPPPRASAPFSSRAALGALTKPR